MAPKLFLQIIPKSSKNRIIFPLQPSNETYPYGYNLGRFTPAYLDFLVTREDTKQVLKECSEAAEGFKFIERVQNIMSLFIAIYLMFVIIIFILSLMALLPVIAIKILLGVAAGGLFILIFWIFFYSKNKNKQQKTVIVEKAFHIFENHKEKFGSVGLRWNMPKNCFYLELWLDYKKFSTDSQLDKKQRRKTKSKPKPSMNIKFLEDQV